MWLNPQVPAGLVTFTEDNLNGKHHFCALILIPAVKTQNLNSLLMCKNIAYKILTMIWKIGKIFNSILNFDMFIGPLYENVIVYGREWSKETNFLRFSKCFLQNKFYWKNEQ